MKTAPLSVKVSICNDLRTGSVRGASPLTAVILTVPEAARLHRAVVLAALQAARAVLVPRTVALPLATQPRGLWSTAPLPASADLIEAGDDVSVHHDHGRGLPRLGVLEEGHQAQGTSGGLLVKLKGITVT